MHFKPRAWGYLTEVFPDAAKNFINTNIRADTFDRFGYDDGNYEDNLWRRFTNPWLSYLESLCYWVDKPVDTFTGFFGKGLIFLAVLLCQPLLAISLNLWTLSGFLAKLVILGVVILVVLIILPFTDVHLGKLKNE